MYYYVFTTGIELSLDSTKRSLSFLNIKIIFMSTTTCNVILNVFVGLGFANAQFFDNMFLHSKIHSDPSVSLFTEQYIFILFKIAALRLLWF